MGRRRNTQRSSGRQGTGRGEQTVSQVPRPNASARQSAGGDGGPPPRPQGRGPYQTLAVCGLLLLAVALIFGRTAQYGFVNYDDGIYVYDNAPISGGLSAEGMSWIFRHEHGGNWHPLTSLSHMVDCQLFGLRAGCHHLTNVLLHAATVILLFLVLGRMSGDFWPSALVAALFAVHPLRVESVAWISERKDVLSGLFFMLTLAAYLAYVHHPFSRTRYLLLLAVFALGLMAKPMLVTVPFVLLLLDYWPLGRMTADAKDADSRDAGGRSGRFVVPSRLLLEKIPLFLLSAIACALAVWSQSAGAALIDIPFPQRIGNAVVSCVSYVVQLFYPAHLAAFYPHPGAALPLGKIFAAAALLVAISAGALAYRRHWPYLLIGWLWFLGMLVPVVGLVQAGSQARADRFTYLSEIGLCIALVWGLAAVARARSFRGGPLAIASALVLALLAAKAWQQTGVWCDSVTLWRSALAANPRNGFAERGLADALAQQGERGEAMQHYQRAVEIDADVPQAHNILGLALAGQGRFAEAIEQYQAALGIDPCSAEAHNNLGSALAARGQVEQAIHHCRQALEIKPNYPDAHNNLGLIFAGRGEIDRAIDQYQQALAIKPDFAQAHNNLGIARARKGQLDEAMGCFRRALELHADSAKAYSNLGLILAARGKIDQALDHYQKALEIDPEFAEAHYNLAVVLQLQGKMPQAIEHLERAVKLRPAYVDAGNRLAWLRATWPEASLRNAGEAVAEAERANQLCGGRQAAVLDTLAAAYAEAGRFPEAVATVRKALALATQQGSAAVLDGMRARLALYEAGRPYRQAVSGPPPAGRKP